jgi:2',3'-cyclic-nucleotide 2'-phosphodiesterase (5'-nucleotidase family)
VGLLGLCTVRRHTKAGLEVLPALPTASRVEEALRKRADVVVAVTHLGYVFDWLLALGAGGRLDVIVGGHSHTLLPEGRSVSAFSGRRTLIVQAGEYYSHVGRVDLTLRRRGGRFEVVEAVASVIPLDEKVGFDPSISRLMSAWKQRARGWRMDAGRETRNREPVSPSK